MIRANKLFYPAIFAIIFAGCASTPELSDQDITQQYDNIAGFETRLAKAKEAGVDYLAPNGFISAKAIYDEALEKARKNQRSEVESRVKEGLRRLDKAETTAEQSRTLMREVLETRQRALAAGADALQPDQFNDIENDLRKATQQVERGDLEEAKQKRPELMNRYSSLELVALKIDATQAAKADIAAAREKLANKYAPKTLKLAEEELQLAVSVLDTNRSDTQKARNHALRASWLADRSVEIVELVKDFDQRDYSPEDIVLWYQEQLSDINQPKGGELPFNKSNHQVIQYLQDQVSTLIKAESQITALQSELASSESQIAMLKEAEKETRKDLEGRMQAVEQASREAQARYDRIQAMFSEREANVYRQGYNVLLETHAFYFPVGGSEVQSENYDLLNKIVKAIKVFPAPLVVVRGHTDSTGSDENNLRLSRLRAEKVAEFLGKLGGIDETSIRSIGYGESRPVASNETEAGRALNRRIEVLIVNK